jgi:hypothetical protein
VIRRRLFAIVATLSFLLCLSTVAVWIRSYYVYDGIPMSQWHSIGVDSDVGSGELHWTADEVPNTAGPSYHYSIKDDPSLQSGFDFTDSAWHVIGFSYRSVDTPLRGGSIMKSRGLTVPYWFLAGCTAVMPAIWMIARVRNRGRTLNGCAACSYNLTGNTSGICPECGTPVPAATGEKPLA